VGRAACACDSAADYVSLCLTICAKKPTNSSLFPATVAVADFALFISNT
jgi:hypothetical protein